jgi:predicted TIM-barrel fold metal-dependent hydrolase
VEGQIGPDEIIDALIADFQERELPQVTPRHVSLPGLPGKADVVVGMRRSGKTWFLYQQIEERLAAGIGRERLLCGSDWPYALLNGDYARIWRETRSLVGGDSMVLAGNAVRLYGLAETPGGTH